MENADPGTSRNEGLRLLHPAPLRADGAGGGARQRRPSVPLWCQGRSRRESAARRFPDAAEAETDTALRVPIEKYRQQAEIRWGRYADLVVSIDGGRRLVFSRRTRQQAAGGRGIVLPEEAIDPNTTLPTYRWAHLVATYDGQRMCLYADGRLIESRPATGPIEAPDRGLLIGLNGDPQRVSHPVSHSRYAVNNNLPLVYGIEGLIDEVRVYDRALTAEQVARSHRRFSHPAEELTSPDLQRRTLPGQVTGEPASRFGAAYTTLKYHELWDNLWRPSPYRDIVVRFDSVPGNVVFWQSPNFGSGWVTVNNKWMSDQSKEIGGPHGCAEHMADKRGRFGHVRLIENTPARVVVHCRYPSIDVGYVFPHVNVWVDEYYLIYPDGAGVERGHEKIREIGKF